VRARGHLPDLTGLVLERTVDGDASVLAYDSTQWLPASPGAAGLFRSVVMNDSVAPTAGDTALWRTVASDTALDRFVGLARMRGWAAVSRAFPGDSTALFSIQLPRYRAVVPPMERLVLRALWRAAHRDVPGARTDVAAVMSIGERMFRREPPIGLMQGVRVLGYAVRAYTKLAAVTRDSVLTRRIQPVSEWLRLTPARFGRLLPTDPDDCALVAADSSLPLGYRVLALEMMGLAGHMRARALVFGLPSSLLARLTPFLEDPDPDIAWYAAAVKRQWEVFNHMSIRGRLRSWAL